MPCIRDWVLLRWQAILPNWSVGTLPFQSASQQMFLHDWQAVSKVYGNAKDLEGEKKPILKKKEQVGGFTQPNFNAY